MNVAGKTAVVTGGSRGIGRAICLETKAVRQKRQPLVNSLVSRLWPCDAMWRTAEK